MSQVGGFFFICFSLSWEKHRREKKKVEGAYVELMGIGRFLRAHWGSIYMTFEPFEPFLQASKCESSRSLAVVIGMMLLSWSIV